MAGDGEKEVVVKWREFGELVFQELWNFCCAHALLRDHGLCAFGEDFVRELTKPCLEHRADDVDVVEFGLFEEIDVEFYIIR